MSYRNIRNLGLLTLFLIILAISLFSYAVTNRSTQRLNYNINAEETRLKVGRLAQLIKYSRANFDDLRSGKIDDLRLVTAPLERAEKEIEQMKKIIVDDSQARPLTTILRGIKMYKSAVLEYEQAAKAPEGAAPAKEAEGEALKVSGTIAQVIQRTIDRMSLQINEKNFSTIKETYHFQKILGLALIGSIIAVLLIALWMGVSLAKPIEQLEKATERIAKGDLETRVEAKSRDEIGKLFNSFNQMVKELRESRAQLVEKAYVDSIITNMVEALIVTDAEGKIMTVNKSACSILGRSQEELVGGDIGLVLGQKERFRKEVMQTIVTKGCLENYEIDYKKEDQNPVPLLFSGSSLKDNKGSQMGFLMVARDITDRKELEKKYRLAELGKLAADMAHEVNNPLMVISGRAELSLMQDIKDEKLIKNLNIIVEYTQRAKDIITRLLRFSRPSKGELREIDINKSIEEVASIVEHQFQLDNIAINKNYSQLPPVVINEKQLQEIFMNLFNNARDSMPGGGAIQVSTSREDDFVKVEIKDTGKGIEKEVLDKIFDPFFTTKDKGTGLGIPLCYNTIRSYGGDLKFESQINEGTAATITLPAKKS